MCDQVPLDVLTCEGQHPGEEPLEERVLVEGETERAFAVEVPDFLVEAEQPNREILKRAPLLDVQVGRQLPVNQESVSRIRVDVFNCEFLLESFCCILRDWQTGLQQLICVYDHWHVLFLRFWEVKRWNKLFLTFLGTNPLAISLLLQTRLNL